MALGHRLSTWQRAAAYIVSLVAVFGHILLTAIPALIGPECGSFAVNIASRGCHIAAAAFIFATVLTVTQADYPRGQVRAPRPLMMSAVGGAAAVFLGFLAAQTFKQCAGLTPWCPADTLEALPHSAQMDLSVEAGAEEELVFTGVAVALALSGTLTARVVIFTANVVLRAMGHWYYANLHTLLAWSLWAAIWSGITVVGAFLIVRRAANSGVSTWAAVLACMVGVVVAHSLWDVAGVAAAIWGLLAWWIAFSVAEFRRSRRPIAAEATPSARQRCERQTEVR